MKYKTLYAVMILVLVICPARIHAFNPDNLAIHGFGGWAYGRTDNENRYLAGNEDGDYKYANFSLNIGAMPYEKLSLHIQTGWNENSRLKEASLDYAFAEWYFADVLILRAGKVKAPFMASTEVYDVGTIRPFFFLPQGVYRQLAAEAYKGIGITGAFYPRDAWELHYDVYGGELNFQPNPYVGLIGQEIRFAHYEPKVRDMIGGRLIIHPPFDGLNIGVSSYAGDVIEEEKLLPGMSLDDWYWFLGASAEYITEKVWLRGEYLGQHESPKVDGDIYYAEAAIQLTDHWQLAGRYEFSEFIVADLETLFSTSFLEHEEIVIGLNYWLNPNLVFKFSYHMVTGNRFANPDKIEDFIAVLMGGKFQEQTNLMLLGVQFSF